MRLLNIGTNLVPYACNLLFLFILKKEIQSLGSLKGQVELKGN